MTTNHDDWIDLGGTLWRYRDYVREVYSQPDDAFYEHWERTALEIAESDDTEFVAAKGRWQRVLLFVRTLARRYQRWRCGL